MRNPQFYVSDKRPILGDLAIQQSGHSETACCAHVAASSDNSRILFRPKLVISAIKWHCNTDVLLLIRPMLIWYASIPRSVCKWWNCYLLPCFIFSSMFDINKNTVQDFPWISGMQNLSRRLISLKSCIPQCSIFTHEVCQWPNDIWSVCASEIYFLRHNIHNIPAL